MVFFIHFKLGGSNGTPSKACSSVLSASASFQTETMFLVAAAKTETPREDLRPGRHLGHSDDLQARKRQVPVHSLPEDIRLPTWCQDSPRRETHRVQCELHLHLLLQGLLNRALLEAASGQRSQDHAEDAEEPGSNQLKTNLPLNS